MVLKQPINYTGNKSKVLFSSLQIFLQFYVYNHISEYNIFYLNIYGNGEKKEKLLNPVFRYLKHLYRP